MNWRTPVAVIVLFSAYVGQAPAPAQEEAPDTPSTAPVGTGEFVARAAPERPAPDYTPWKSTKQLMQANALESESLLPPALLGKRLLIASWAPFRGAEPNARPENRRIDLYEIDPKTGTRKALCSMPQRIDPTASDSSIMNASLAPKAMVWKDTYVLTTVVDGVVLLPADGKTKPRKIGKEEGLPSVAIQAAAVVGDVLYLATGKPDEPCSFVACDLPTGKCERIAKGAVAGPRPADGKAPAPGAPPASPFTPEAATAVFAMVGDAEAQKVYFVANQRRTRQGGLWEYDPATKVFTHRLAIHAYQPYADGFFMARLWGAGKGRVLVFLNDGGRWDASFWFDMGTAKGQWLVRPPRIEVAGLEVPEGKPLVAAKLAPELRAGTISDVHLIAPPRDGWLWHIGSLNRQARVEGKSTRVPMAAGYLGRIRLSDLREEYFRDQDMTEGIYGVTPGLQMPDGSWIFLSNGRMFRAEAP